MVEESEIARLTADQRERLGAETDRHVDEIMEKIGDARAFLLRHKWCRCVHTVRIAYAAGGKLLGLLCSIEPVVGSGADEELWVIAGDLPIAYIVTDEAPDVKRALECYVFEMSKWVEAVRSGKPIRDVIPVNAEATAENAQMLETRLHFITDKVLPSL